MRGFDELVHEAEVAPIEGWNFAWLDGRAIEDRPSGLLRQGGRARHDRGEPARDRSRRRCHDRRAFGASLTGRRDRRFRGQRRPRGAAATGAVCTWSSPPRRTPGCRLPEKPSSS